VQKPYAPARNNAAPHSRESAMNGKHAIYLCPNAVLAFFLLASVALAARYASLCYSVNLPEGWRVNREAGLDAYESPGAENGIWIRAEHNDGLTAEQIIAAMEEDYALLPLADSGGYFYMDEDGWRGFLIADDSVSFDILVQAPFADMPQFLASLKAADGARAMDAFFAVLRRPAVVNWLSFSSGQ
jgi:hypothetical protein